MGVKGLEVISGQVPEQEWEPGHLDSRQMGWNYSEGTVEAEEKKFTWFWRLSNICR